MRPSVGTLLLALVLVFPATAQDIPLSDLQVAPLTPVARCPEAAEGTPALLRPSCTFQCWEATLGGQSWPARAATGAQWMPNCALDFEGACPFALPAKGLLVDGTFEVHSWSIVAPADAQQRSVLLVPVDVACTEEECPGSDPCCHKCGHGSWQIANRRPEVRVYSASGAAALPRCDLDGCGDCSYQLTATGAETGGLFVVSSSSETTDDVLFPVARCTLIACVGGNPCCNTCGFMGWSIHGSKGALSAIPGEGVEALPPCQLDGCGACPWQLLVTGQEQGDHFVVESWERYP